MTEARNGNGKDKPEPTAVELIADEYCSKSRTKHAVSYKSALEKAAEEVFHLRSKCGNSMGKCSNLNSNSNSLMSAKL
jgi:hypothetical protein